MGDQTNPIESAISDLRSVHEELQVLEARRMELREQQAQLQRFVRLAKTIGYIDDLPEELSEEDVEVTSRVFVTGGGSTGASLLSTLSGHSTGGKKSYYRATSDPRYRVDADDDGDEPDLDEDDPGSPIGRPTTKDAALEVLERYSDPAVGLDIAEIENIMMSVGWDPGDSPNPTAMVRSALQRLLKDEDQIFRVGRGRYASGFAGVSAAKDRQGG